MEELKLRELQTKLIANISAAFKAGNKNVMVAAPCGFGKTEISTAMLIETNKNYKKGAFICDRISLINQTSERFDKYGLPHGIMQAQHFRYDSAARIQLCSIQTLLRREWPETNLMVVDEAHILSKAMRERLEKRDCFAVGLSATPITVGLGKYFDTVINAATTNELIARGDLVPFRVFAATEPDMKDVHVKAGEYDEKETEKLSMPIVGDVVSEYLSHGKGKKFICFAVSVLHAEELRRQFNNAGIVTELYTYRQDDDEKVATVKEFRKPDSYIRGLISIESLTRGFDVADVEVLILARPLRKALHVFIQMLGRVLRTASGKTEAIVLDLSGNTIRFWAKLQKYLEDGVTELDDGKKKDKEKQEPKEKEPVKCPVCHHVHMPAPTCPACGHIYAKSMVIQHEAGILHEINVAERNAATAKEHKWQVELLGLAAERGYNPGWAYHKFIEKFGHKPEYGYPKPKTPSTEVKNWVTSRNIAYAMAKKKHG